MLFKIPYKTCRLFIILGPFSAKGPQSIKKALGFPLKVDGVSRLREMLKKHWSQSILEHRKRLIKIPYKPCWFLIILEPETQKGLQNDQKAIGFSLKVDGVLRPCEMLEKHWSQSILEHRKRLIKIRYKTCRLWGRLVSFSQNCTQNIKKHQVFTKS